ncbi:MAG: VanZ family protein [Candidatus Omnitrophica bacterium]|nr:VanZ family protein [Candidatus Omnitrophota bacterium]MBU4345960.1 VanZ family protein [Candidatus Omnitrophota bacterium]MBU4472706.1 VanZ family protein [Candidatus Omnitrophota bacterium]MCG2705988.1 VanZ family protein [Candidatus Omnitrophota bacterium]
MRKTNLRRFWWTIITLYILFTYASLGVMPAIWSRLNAFLGGRGVIAQYIIYSLVGISVFMYILFFKKEKSITRYFLFLLFIGIFFIMVKFEKNPGEKIHMAQYGLLGVLLYNALKIESGSFSKNLYLLGSFICLVVGAVDEVIQWILPNRFFTWHDVFINGASGIIALLVIRFNILKEAKLA